jgi:hypothetical protein
MGADTRFQMVAPVHGRISSLLLVGLTSISLLVALTLRQAKIKLFVTKLGMPHLVDFWWSLTLDVAEA